MCISSGCENQQIYARCGNLFHGSLIIANTLTNDYILRALYLEYFSLICDLNK